VAIYPAPLGNGVAKSVRSSPARWRPLAARNLP
jgi:hypothetical protein